MESIEVMRMAIVDFHKEKSCLPRANTEHRGVSIAFDCNSPCEIGLMVHINIRLSASLIATLRALSNRYEGQNIALGVSHQDKTGRISKFAVIDLIVDGDVELGLQVSEVRRFSLKSEPSEEWMEAIKKEIVSSVDMMNEGHVDPTIHKMISDILDQTAELAMSEGDQSERVLH